MLKAIIIDDEPYCCEALAILLEDLPEVQVVATCFSAADGLIAIQKHTPEIVFLDVEMPRMNGFEMLEQLPSINFEIIFTTSYDQYALKAIRFSALDYLLKPVDDEELKQAVQKLVRRSQKPIQQQLELLLQKIHQPAIPVTKIALPTMEGLEMVSINSIISCESDSNYTTVFFKNKRKIVISRTLKEMEELLEDYSIIRVHRCYLINLNEVEKYIKGEGGYLIMSDGSNIDVSKGRKDELIRKLQPSKF
jgi:two-component system LytT family response regulator